MIVIEEISPQKITNSPCIVTFGNFDGVHKGHCALFRDVITQARVHNAKACIYTFSNHPLDILRSETSVSRLTTNTQKLRLFEELGFDIVITVPFSRAIAAMRPEQFIKSLMNMLPLHTMIVGKDVRFGENREGDLDVLLSLALQYNFFVLCTDFICENETKISSTSIRNFLQKGDVEAVIGYLGRPYSIEGSIIPGSQTARKLSCPTLNMQIEQKACPKEGVYAARACFNGKKQWYPACAYIGRAQTLHPRKLPLLEVHLLEDIESLATSTTMEVEFLSFLRPDCIFSSKEELLNQIQIDIIRAKKEIYEKRVENLSFHSCR